ncbi:hypothetical protein [Paenibacillus maysiensis]|uniref:hypothetical protein n=1 Tax=Paenibacillus maysiensis TaxID=1155954 RepID=UPI00046F5AFA|nr:hypothetical protein [Paenibacillus maysiensis]
MKTIVQVFTDGENQPIGLTEIIDSWLENWNANYLDIGEIEFEPGRNLKESSVANSIPALLKRISTIRNPDIFFVAKQTQDLLGGVEVTVHSPDGSNADKRYPLLWASGQYGVNSFVVCPYQKTRPTGAQNRLPNRHSKRNIEFLSDWDVNNPASFIRQIIPIIDLQNGSLDALPTKVQLSILSWKDIGQFFSHTLARKIIGENQKVINHLEEFRAKLKLLADACLASAEYSNQSSLLKLENKWIQIYNSRPDSGHWERGEGQFDSIDGRVMFTLDEIEKLPPIGKPEKFELWLPQMVSNHAWLLEQRSRGYGSKRLRNIVIELNGKCKIKYADDLTSEDWDLLKANKGLLLERLDWKPDFYKVSEMVNLLERNGVAKKGLKSTNRIIIEQIIEQLHREDLYFSSHRAYKIGWESEFAARLKELPANSTLLVPRIPEALLPKVHGVEVIAAENCTKLHLLTLRQLHRRG